MERESATTAQVERAGRVEERCELGETVAAARPGAIAASSSRTSAPSVPALTALTPSSASSRRLSPTPDGP